MMFEWWRLVGCSGFMLLNALDRIQGFWLQICNKKASFLWDCVSCAIFWVSWLERNTRIFLEKSEVDSLWEKFRHLAYFWVLIFPPFEGIPLFLISRDWTMVCDLY